MRSDRFGRVARKFSQLLVTLFVLSGIAFGQCLPLTFSADTRFGPNGDGKVTIPFSGNALGIEIALQSSGKLIAAHRGPNSRLAAVRLERDGRLDFTFGFNGFAEIPTSASDSLEAMDVGPDDKVVVGGNSSGNIVLGRFNANGQPDTSFGTNGRVITDLGGTEGVQSIVVQPDGKILVAGRHTSASGSRIAVVRYNASGSLDFLFSGDGKVLLSEGILSKGKISMARQSNGDFYVGGNTAAAMVVHKLSSAGTIYSTFGEAVIDISADDQLYSLAVGPSSTVLVGGARKIGTGDYDPIVARVNKLGGLDSRFAGDGVFEFTGGNNFDFVSDVATGPNNAIVASIRLGLPYTSVLATLPADGNPGCIFANLGEAVTDRNAVNSIIVDGNNIYGVGFHDTTLNQLLITGHVLN